MAYLNHDGAMPGADGAGDMLMDTSPFTPEGPAGLGSSTMGNGAQMGMLDLNSFIENLQHQQQQHMGNGGLANGGLGSGAAFPTYAGGKDAHQTELLMHLEQLHGLSSAGPVGSGAWNPAINVHQPASGGVAHNGSMAGLDWGDSQLKNNTWASMSLEQQQVQFETADGTILDSRLTPLFIPRTDKESDVSSIASSAPLLSSDMSTISQASSAHSANSALFFHYPSPRPISPESNAIMNPDGTIMSSHAMNMISPGSAGGLNGSNMGPSPGARLMQNDLRRSVETVQRRKRALTIPNSNAKTVMKAYMSNPPSLNGSSNSVAGPHGDGTSQLSPIPSSPFGDGLHTQGFYYQNNTAATAIASQAQPLSFPFTAQHQHRLNSDFLPYSASPNNDSGASSAPGTPPSLARIPIMPLSSTRAGNNNTGANSPPPTPEEIFRKLDDDLRAINFDDVTVAELKEHLRMRSLPSSGKKALLVQRLQDEIRVCNARRDGTLRPEEDPRHPLFIPQGGGGSNPSLHASSVATASPPLSAAARHHSLIMHSLISRSSSSPSTTNSNGSTNSLHSTTNSPSSALLSSSPHSAHHLSHPSPSSSTASSASTYSQPSPLSAGAGAAPMSPKRSSLVRSSLGRQRSHSDRGIRPRLEDLGPINHVPAAPALAQRMMPSSSTSVGNSPTMAALQTQDGAPGPGGAGVGRRRMLANELAPLATTFTPSALGSRLAQHQQLQHPQQQMQSMYGEPQSAVVMPTGGGMLSAEEEGFMRSLTAGIVYPSNQLTGSVLELTTGTMAMNIDGEFERSCFQFALLNCFFS
ncbi:hypothetical protein HK101_007541 [Irineochytrium annulatum]|nr:hypothetical protein HK101_007541 [Irineochytrium annulatum]